MQWLLQCSTKFWAPDSPQGFSTSWRTISPTTSILPEQDSQTRDQIKKEKEKKRDRDRKKGQTLTSIPIEQESVYGGWASAQSHFC